MRVNKFSGLLLVLILLPLMGCSTAMNYAVAKMGKAVIQAEKTASLSDVQVGGGIGSNIAPAELGLVDQSMFEGWIPGGDLVALTFTSKKNGAGSFYDIDGAVTIDGQPAQKLYPGIYGAFSAPNPSPRKIEIVTTTGEQARFTIAPNKNHIKVISINGQTDKISLDLTKDVVVELDVSQVPKNTMLKVGLAITQVGIKSITRACYIRSAEKITIPAAVFRNMDFVPGGSALYSYDNSFLSVSVAGVEKATEVSGAFASVSYNSAYEDGKFVSVNNNPILNVGLTAKGEDKLKNGEMSYDLFKPNAFRSRPSEHITKIGVISFGVSGITARKHEFKLSQEMKYGGKELRSTATTTLTFPQQSNEVWDAVLETMYPEIISIVQSEFNGAAVLPLEAVTQTAGYKSIEMVSKADFNGPGSFSKAYRNVKLLTEAPGDAKNPGANSAKEKIMKESGADAIMTIKLELEVGVDGFKDLDETLKATNSLETKLKESDFGVIVPKLTFEIVGKPGVSADADVNAARETKYVTGAIAGKGIPAEEIGLEVSIHDEATTLFSAKTETKVFHKVGVISPEKLDKLIRKSDLLAEFSKALKAIKEKEKANGDYRIVWNLQK